jgi:acyl-CoA reductase-like NAD-dependent aldehyde dehydrogenase
MGEVANAVHRKSTADKRHDLHIIEGTLLRQIVGLEHGDVNSAHHQCIDPAAIAKTLVVSARSGDHTIEGVEYADPQQKGFMLCVQWHPERMADRDTNPLSVNIKKSFLQQVRMSTMDTFQVVNPATEVCIATLKEDDSQSLGQKFIALKKGQKAWASLPLESRISVLNKFAGLLSENMEKIAGTLSEEVGKPLQQSRNEVNGAKGRIEWLTAHAAKYLSDEIMSEGNGMVEKIRYEPLGVVCNISAWNYPYLVGTNVFVPALLAGNAVLYKPSEYSSLTGLHIESLLKQAGVPEDVFMVGLGGAATGQALLELPFDGYFFTGSYKTGKYIYETVAPKMVPCQCELGGKDPLYITDDIVDVGSVAAGTADGAFYNNGQSCCSVERIYVHEKIYDQYVEAFVKEVNSWKMGAPEEEGVYIGPLTRKSQLDFLLTQIKDATDKGATILTGGNAVPGKGYFFEPTVLVNVDHGMSVMKEESFGPVIGIMKVKDDKEALALMNDTDYGLTAGVYCTEKQRADAILQEVDAGTGYWNCCDRVSAALPWSGRKHSGFGATLSHAGIRAFTKPKAYHLRG